MSLNPSQYIFVLTLAYQNRQLTKDLQSAAGLHFCEVCWIRKRLSLIFMSELPYKIQLASRFRSKHPNLQGYVLRTRYLP